MADQGILRAEQRVREMNRMTQHYTEQGNRYMLEQPPPILQPVHSDDQSPRPHPQKGGQKHPEHHDKGLLSLSQIEGDKLLLIALIYLLIKENADIKLILAIAYLLL